MAIIKDKTKMGRPADYSTAEIKAIINDYVAYTGGSILLRATKIAEYATKEKGMKKFYYYTINRNVEAKAYMAMLNDQIKTHPNVKIDSAITYFEPYDGKKFAAMTKDKQIRAINNLNEYVMGVVDSNISLVKQITDLTLTLKRKENDIRKLNENIECIKKEQLEARAKFQQEINILKDKIANLVENEKKKEQILHLLWDCEAETILKKLGIFEGDEVEIATDRIITDPKENIREKLVKNKVLSFENKKAKDQFQNKMKEL